MVVLYINLDRIPLLKPEGVVTEVTPVSEDLAPRTKSLQDVFVHCFAVLNS